MRKLDLNPSSRVKEEAKEMSKYILTLLRGNRGIEANGNSMFTMTEMLRQYFTWGANKFYYICATDGSIGIQFNVSGLKFKGRVRIWYNYATDYFDVEFLKARSDVHAVQEYEEIDCLQLHNICHKFIERTDDMEVFG